MISVVYNSQKENTEKVLAEIKFLQETYNLETYLVDAFPITDDEQLDNIRKSELLIIIGGDGTILNALSSLEYRDVPPIIAVNTGSLGLMSCMSKERFRNFFISYLEHGKEVVQEDDRYLIRAEINGNEFFALNDFVMQKDDRRKMLTMDCSFNNSKPIKARLDGIIIASPTGSTAYNLSAGGPIMHPKGIPAMIFNPICPHSLTLKPLILTKRDVLRIQVSHFREENKQSYLIIDGVKEVKVPPAEPIEFCVSKNKIIFYRPKDDNYYDLLYDKLKWAY